MYTIFDFKIEYDSAKDKYYLSKNNGQLINTFYGEWALKEFLSNEYGLYGPQVASAIYNA